MRYASIVTLSITFALALSTAALAQAPPAPTLSDIAGCNEEAANRTGASALPRPGGETPVPGSARPGEKADPTGSVIAQAPDPLVKGMDATRADDPQYRAAYRECMRARMRAR